MSGLYPRFNSWLWSQNKRKVDAELTAAREGQNWYSGFSVHNNTDSFLRNFPDVYSQIIYCTYHKVIK